MMINIVLLMSVVCFYAYETADLHELNTYPTYTYQVFLPNPNHACEFF